MTQSRPDTVWEYVEITCYLERLALSLITDVNVAPEGVYVEITCYLERLALSLTTDVNVAPEGVYVANIERLFEWLCNVQLDQCPGFLC